MPCITYFTTRVNDKAGDRHELIEFFRGARLFDPAYAKTLDSLKAMNLLDKLRPYKALDDEDSSLVDLMKAGWSAYRQNAVKVVKVFDFEKDNAAILSWHYQMYLRIEADQAEDRKKRKGCRYCTSKSGTCRCYKGLIAWWQAAKLCALVMPSSAAAERVFSILNNLYNDQQTRALVDSILVSLYLAYNKRKVIVPRASNKDKEDDDNGSYI